MKLEFISDHASSSKREHELRSSLARSHAARFGHRKRKEAESSVGTPRATSFRSYAAPTALGYVSNTSIAQYTQNSGFVVGDADTDAPTTSTTDDADTLTDTDPYQTTGTALSFLSTQNVLIRGQSDPFNASPIPIDSRVHEMISYYKNDSLFQRHRVDAKTWLQNQGAQADWRDMGDSLADAGIGYAFLAQTSACIALESISSFQHYQRLSYEYSQRSSTDLRIHLQSRPQDWDTDRTWRLISMLQNFELFTQNREAAMVHGKMLQNLYTHRLAHGKEIDSRRLLHSLYVDVHMAVIYLVRPNFKPTTEFVEQFSQLANALYRDIALMSDASIMRRLDEQVSGKRLRHLFLRWEQWRVITSFYARRLWSFITQLQTVNYLLDVEEKLLNRQLNSTSRTLLHIQAYISLAMLYFFRMTSIPEHFTTRAHMPFQTNLIRRLHYHLKISDGLEVRGLQSRARLWALFVGAHSEHQAAALELQLLPPHISPDWFKAHFAEQVKRCGLYNWTEIREVLEGFMYCDIKPDPSTWYLGLLLSDLW